MREPEAPEESERRSIDDVVERLTAKYPAVDRDEITAIVHAEYEAFDGKPVRDFVPVLVEKSAKKRVKALAHAS